MTQDDQPRPGSPPFPAALGPPVALVSLGSNLGEPAGNLRTAVGRLAGVSTTTLRCSSLWLTAPVDCPPGSPQFVNAVVSLTPHPGETPESLLGRLQAIERQFGRQPKRVLNEPRPLDLDLIAFGRETRHKAQLMLPHPRAHLRRFVLQPLAEIAPELRLPGQVLTVAELLAHLPAEPGMVCLGPLAG